MRACEDYQSTLDRAKILFPPANPCLDRAQKCDLIQIFSGRCPFDEWLAAFKGERTKAIVTNRLMRIMQGNFGLCRGLGGGLQETKIDFGPGLRVYFAEDGDTIVVLLCGGDKSTQPKDIENAREFWTDYQKEWVMAKRVRDYEEDLAEQLKDAEFAAEYLNVSLDDAERESIADRLEKLRLGSSAVTGIALPEFEIREVIPRSSRGHPAAMTVPTAPVQKVELWLKLEFSGTLTAVQEIAVSALKKHDNGVLVAPPGVGKAKGFDACACSPPTTAGSVEVTTLVVS